MTIYYPKALQLFTICSLSREPFCNKQEFIPYRDLGSREGGANSSCTYDRLAIATCILVDVTLLSGNRSIPIQYQVWGYIYCTLHIHPHLPTTPPPPTHSKLLLQYYSDPNLGGIEDTIDYCPTQYVSSCPAPTSAHCLRHADISVPCLMWW